MSDRIQVSRPLIEPIYSQNEPNQPIDPGRVAVQFDLQGTAYQETANVTMKFVPDDRLKFTAPLEGKDRRSPGSCSRHSFTLTAPLSLRYPNGG